MRQAFPATWLYRTCFQPEPSDFFEEPCVDLLREGLKKTQGTPFGFSRLFQALSRNGLVA
jgi:hypothetical protein